MLMRARSDAQGLQSVNTLTYTAQMVESSRADKEKAAFNEVHARVQHAHALPMHTHMHRTLCVTALPCLTAVSCRAGGAVDRCAGGGLG